MFIKVLLFHNCKLFFFSLSLLTKGDFVQFCERREWWKLARLRREVRGCEVRGKVNNEDEQKRETKEKGKGN